MVHVVGPVVVAGVMPYLLTGLAKSKDFGPEQNKQTRAWQAQLTGWRQRAYWAHQNAFEAFPIFAVMVILAYLAQPTSVVASAAAWAFIGLRIAYAACFIGDKAALRSRVWYGTMAAIAVLILVALRVL